jgi:protein TonB
LMWNGTNFQMDVAGPKSRVWSARAVALTIVFALHVAFLVLLSVRSPQVIDESPALVQVLDIPVAPSKPDIPTVADLEMLSLPLPQVPLPEISIDDSPASTGNDSPPVPVVFSPMQDAISGRGSGQGQGEGRQNARGSGSAPDTWTACSVRNMPTYPQSAKVYGIQQARVTLLVPLDEQGAIGKIQVLRSSGLQLLDDAAVRAVKRWKCSPVVEDGRPVQAITKQEIEFLLRR